MDCLLERHRAAWPTATASITGPGNEHVPSWWKVGAMARADFESAPFELRILWEIKRLLTKE